MKKSFLSRLFYKSKHTKKETSGNLTAMLLPSILGIIICAICLMGSTWAWFTATQSTETANIQAASYTVTTAISDQNNTLVATENSATLQQGTYTVTLTATGDASTGYCKVIIGNTEKLTQQFPSAKYPEKSITFTLVVNEATTVEFIPYWGTSATDEAERILNGSEHTYGTAPAPQENPPAEEKDETTEPPADTTEDTTTEETTTTETEPTLDPTQYTVQSGDSLSKIADLYGESVKRLQVYNNIENPSQIYAGQVIKIPPAGWEIPETATEGTTPPTTTEPTETTSQTEATTEPDETTMVQEETTGDTTETTVPQDTTGTDENASESDGNE